MRRHPLGSALWVLCASLVPPAGAEAPVAWDQSDLSLGNSLNISAAVQADDFVLAEPTRLLAATLWLSDDVVNDNGALDGFAHALGWAVYEDAGGEPGAIVRSGRSIALVERDTGLQEEVGPSDTVAVRFELEPPLSLDPGTYWLAIREGTWGAGADATIVWWQDAVNGSGAPSVRSAEMAGPVNWIPNASDLAFTLDGATPIWDLSSGLFTGRDSWPIGDWVEASDFSLAATTRISAAEVWLADEEVNDDGLLGSFSGTLGWAIYQDNGSGKPGAILYSGQDAAPLVVDTGEQDVADSDIARVRLRFGRTLTLPPGAYWLALHEGEWGEPFDGTDLYWLWAEKGGGEPSWGDEVETNPTSWDLGPDEDTAFVLFEETIFGSGFEAGTGCAWAGATNDCP